MSVHASHIAAIGDYTFPVQDVVARFSAPLLYIGWDEHMMFCAPHCVPAPAEATFGAFMQDTLSAMYSTHPDFARIDWERVNWLKNDIFWFPRKNQSLVENGIAHKDVVRFRTPGLSGLSASGS